MAVNVQMGVDLGNFKSGIAEAKNEVKTLDANMKLIDATFKATGNSEQALAQKMQTLNSKFTAQKNMAKQYEQALKQMTSAGVDPASAAYQKMAQGLLQAQTGMMETQAAINELGQSASNAAGSADNLTNSVSSIGKKMSLEQVIGGIDKITTGLENAAKKAVDLGQKLWDTIMDSARRADDTATLADMYGIPLERFMQMQRLLGVDVETTADNMLGAWDKLKKGIGSDSGSVNEILKSLHVTMTELQDTGDGILEFVPKDTFTLFWEAGQAIKNLGNEAEQEAKATKLFGKSWRELLSLFEKYETVEDFNKAVSEQTVNSEEQIRDLAALNDAVTDLENSWTTLKDQVLGYLAPALEKGAIAISGLLDSLTEYVKSDEGQEMLENLGKAVEGLFSNLNSIDPQQVIAGFSGVFNTVVDGLKWLEKNSGAVVDAMKAIVGGWALLELSGGALKIYTIINGISGLTAGTAASAGATAGASWAGAFASAAMKAAPFLAFMYTLLNPSSTGNDDLFTPEGKVTELGKEMGLTEEQAKEELKIQQQIADSWEAVRERTGLTESQISQLKNFWSFYKGRQNGQEGYTLENYNESWANLQKEFEGQEATLTAYVKKMSDLLGSEGGMEKHLDLSFFDIDKDGLKIPVVPEAQSDSKASLEEQIGILEVMAKVKVAGLSLFGIELPGYANGLSYVPYDNYLALLHKGERVMTARENRNYTYNSHNYFGNVNLNNGQDIDALCNSIDRHNRRAQSGFGS